MRAGTLQVVSGTAILVLIGALWGGRIWEERRRESQSASQFAQAIGRYARDVTALSHSVTQELDSPDCTNNCPLTFHQGLSAAALTLSSSAASFAWSDPAIYGTFKDLGTGGKVVLGFAPNAQSVSTFLQATQPAVARIAAEANSPETEIIKQQALKLALENDNLRLQNRKLALEIEDRPGIVTQLFSSGANVFTWIVTTMGALIAILVGLKKLREQKADDSG
jgi:hypothetical protein